MVDRAAAGRDFCLAPRYAAAGDQFRRCITALLDGRRFRPAALSGTTAGLLFDEYVERVCALGSHGLGPDATMLRAAGAIAVGVIGSDPCGGSALRCARRARFERKLGNDGRALDRLESIARHAHVSVASTYGPLLAITASSLVFFSLVALYLIFKQHEKLAAIALAVSMIPAGLSMMVGVAKIAPYFSLADVARFLNPRLDDRRR